MSIGQDDGAGSGSSGEIRRLALSPPHHTGSDWFFTTRDNTPGTGLAYLDIGYGSNRAISITDPGNVGIGTTSPQSSQDSRSIKLDVAENIVAKDVYLDNPKSGSPRWASEGGGRYCYTYYSKSTSSCNCPSGETNKKNLGSWGYCNPYYGDASLYIFRPPGFSCADMWPSIPCGSVDRGLACVCCGE